MASHHDTVFDSTKPALVLLYGNTSKKHRYLDRDVVLIGRARGCDFGLEAPDISSIHCLITRQGGGFTLRDCQSRAGTKINGNLVRESTLRDGDLLQLGPFSFRIHLPAAGLPPTTATGSRLMHLERSRRNLARLALRQRKLASIDTSESVSESRVLVEEQLSKKASALRMRVKDYEQRVRVLEDAERDLSRDREAIQREQAAFREQMQKAEAELAERRKRADAEIEAQKKQFLPVPSASSSAVDLSGARDPGDDLRRQLDEQRQQLAAEAEQIEQRRLALQAQEEQIRQRETQLAEEAAQQQIREREAQAASQRLDKREQKLQVLEQNLQPRLKEHEARCRELDLQQREATAAAKLARQRAEEAKALAQQVEAKQRALQEEARQLEQRQRDVEALARQLESREQRLQAQGGSVESLSIQQQEFATKVQEFERLQKEFFTMRDQGLQAPSAMLQRLSQQKAALALAEEMLREQRQSLDDVLADLQENPVIAAPADDGELQELRAENERLRREVATRSGGQDARLEQLQSENEELQRMLVAMEEERQRRPAEAPNASDELLRLRQRVAEQEAELRQRDHAGEDALGHTEARAAEAQFSEYRRQLELDRQKLHVEIEQVRIRNQELDEATREMELEMSRDRADLARERQRLERLREEVRLETERLQREAGMRERLAPVQNLREELNNKRLGNDQTPKPGKDDATPQRLRGLRN